MRAEAYRKPLGPEQARVGTLNWNVVIENGRTPWGHVLAFAFDGLTWIVVDPHIGWTEIYTVAPDEIDGWIVEMTENATVWRIEGQRHAPMLPGFFCVGTIKRLIGLRSGAFSPAGLRRDLVRAGARQEYRRESQSPEGRPEAEVGA